MPVGCRGPGCCGQIRQAAPERFLGRFRVAASLQRQGSRRTHFPQRSAEGAQVESGLAEDRFGRLGVAPHGGLFETAAPGRVHHPLAVRRVNGYPHMPPLLKALDRLILGKGLDEDRKVA